jgi:hypothetical protein
MGPEDSSLGIRIPAATVMGDHEWFLTEMLKK